MNQLVDKKCRACELGEEKLGPSDIEALMTHTPNWTVKDNHEISRRLKFKNFAEALAFVNKVGAIAESEGHHPDCLITHGSPTLADSLPSSTGKQMFSRPLSRQGALPAKRVEEHPDIEFGWGYVTIKLFTHSVDGLSENDFIMAAKIDTLLAPSIVKTLN